MTTYLDLINQQPVNPRTVGLEWLVNESEKLLSYFHWKEPNKVLFEEINPIDWVMEGINPRFVNQGYTRLRVGDNTGKLTFPVVSYGGVDKVDPALKEINPNWDNNVSKRAAQSIGIRWANAILDPTQTGSATDALVSLPAYCASMGREYTPAANGGALNLIYLDRMIQMCRRVSNTAFFLVSDKLFARLSQLTRNQSIAGNMSLTPDTLGTPILRYNGIPIYGAGKTATNMERIDYNETTGTETEGSSIYFMYTGDDGVYGLKRDLIDYISPYKQWETLTDGTLAPVYVHEIAQPLGVAVATPTAVVRLRGITDSVIVDEA